MTDRRRRFAAATADNTLVLNGSPFVEGKHALRLAAAADFARTASSRVFYAHTLGGCDELVVRRCFFVCWNEMVPCWHNYRRFTAVNMAGSRIIAYPSDNEAVYAALTLGLRDYFNKSGFADGVVLGLSGGVDSALVATLAVDALGAARVTAMMLPTAYTSEASLEDAAALAKNLGIEYIQMPINDAVGVAGGVITPHLCSRDDDTTMENVQSRMRGLLLMALANNRNLLLLATGNKSEIACGYATLYGDMNGGFRTDKRCVKDKSVGAVSLAQPPRRENAYSLTALLRAHPVPSCALTKLIQDTLPPYDVLDAMLQAHLQRQTPAQMWEKYGDAATTDFYRRLATSEFKRRQGVMGTKISECAFGRDWRMPVATRYRYD